MTLLKLIINLNMVSPLLLTLIVALSQIKVMVLQVAPVVCMGRVLEQAIPVVPQDLVECMDRTRVVQELAHQALKALTGVPQDSNNNHQLPHPNTDKKKQRIVRVMDKPNKT